jgi:hypothetical protein
VSGELKMRLTREELHELVWSTPIEQLAKKYGFSDRGFEKVCERHLIPVPPWSYWTKLEAGQPVKTPPCRAVKSAALQIVDLRLKGPRGQSDYLAKVLAEAKADDGDQASNPGEKKYAEATLASRAPIATQISTLRPELVSFIAALRRQPPDRDGFVYYKYVKVPPNEISRAGCFLSAVLDGLIPYGFTLHEGANRLGFVKEDCAINFRIEAPRKRVTTPTRSGWNQHEYVHAGRLEFTIYGNAEGIQKRWIDNDSRRIEAAISDIVESILVNHLIEKEREADRKAGEARRANLAQRRELANLRTAREVKRLAFLHEIANARSEIEALQITIGRVDRSGPLPPEYGRMLEWAKGRLFALEDETTSGAIQKALIDQDLFPEPDNLFDPEGDPPAKQNYWDD